MATTITTRRSWPREAEKNAQELVAEEERAKRKAEKKKLKKKKQKDRKKREKLGQGQKDKENTDPSPPSGPAGTGLSSSGAEDEGCSPEPSSCPGDSTVPSGEPGPEDTAGTEEELDLSCTFVCKAREKAGVRLPPPVTDQSPRTQNVEPSRKVPEKASGEPVGRPVSPQPLQPRPPSPSTVEQSLALAGHGIEAAQMGQHTEAVWAFTVALELNPREHRFLGNRSYCLEKLGRYEEALADAEAALALRPGWPKGSFRKGKALRGLQVPSGPQRYAEAAHAFEELLLQDGACAEAAAQLEDCRALLQVRSSGDLGGGAQSGAMLALGDTRMAFGRDCFPLWVGNVTSHINEKVLRRAFGRFGEIRSMRLLPGRHCAFINFSGKSEAEEAFRAMQGATLEGSKLLLQLKHPAHATPAPVPRAKGKATPGGLLS
ncbi:Tetratricopeptide repeat protein 31 [Lonchura striata]|uniref:Tetratricopeptide repeat protein 31 n=1 Tax=Lonchura striata TaxID=40157 RepID=A0A218UT30_9PASE|nr:Tetratricopeptide repeat protein 31 [Lonchura striata domestica]